MKENIIASVIGLIIIGSVYFYINKDNLSFNFYNVTSYKSYDNAEEVLGARSDEGFLKQQLKDANKKEKEAEVVVNNVSIVDGKQIIEIKAKGGFLPRKSIAKAGVPTILRLNTNGTFDCSSSVRIPSMKISQILPQTGTTDIDLGILDVTVLHGACGMGMYPFEIDFQ